MENQQQPPPPKPVVIYFCAPITHPATTKLRTTLCNAVSIGSPSITVFMSSSGGAVDEGLALYGFIRSLPVEITIHNIGSVDSIALAVYMAAARRLTTEDATFMMHDFYFPQPIAVSNRHQATDISVGLTNSRNRFMKILKSRSNMTDSQFQDLKFLEEASVKCAVTAKEVGICHDIQDAVAPPTAELFNIEY